MLSIRRVGSSLLCSCCTEGIGPICAWLSGNVARVMADHIGGYSHGYLLTHSRSWPLGRPWLWPNASRPTVFLCRGARGVNVRICRCPADFRSPLVLSPGWRSMTAGLLHVQVFDGLAGDLCDEVEVLVEMQHCKAGQFRGRRDDQVGH